VADGNSYDDITSGGGFSTYYPQHTWQSAAVSGYLSTAAGLGKSPEAGYAANGRAYPDISLAGISYVVVIGGTSFSVSGTSASCPAVAGFISNINAARLAIGKGSVGWINPTLYTKGSSFVNDITSGNIKCVADGTCCSTGFYATAGWDPATGLGSVNYGKMSSLFLALGEISTAYVSPREPVLAAGINCDASDSMDDYNVYFLLLNNFILISLPFLSFLSVCRKLQWYAHSDYRGLSACFRRGRARCRDGFPLPQTLGCATEP
jgi:hypothetical protein